MRYPYAVAGPIRACRRRAYLLAVLLVAFAGACGKRTPAHKTNPAASALGGDARAPAEADILRQSLLSFEAYRRKVPGSPGVYRIRIECAGRHLFYCGFPHSLDPNDSHFVRLEDFWRQYLGVSQPARRLVLVEGGLRPLKATREQAIAEAGGEGGLLTLLAHQAGVRKMLSPEPGPKQAVERHAGRASREQICHAYVARRIALWHRFEERPRLDGYLRKSSWLAAMDCDLGLEHVARMHESLFSTPFDVEDRAFFRHITDPARSDTLVNRILREDTRLRDEHIVTEIVRHFRSGRDLFVVFGTAHAVMQEPALRRLLCDRCPGHCRSESHS